MPYSILLVDDDGDFREQISELLDDYTVCGAADGGAALALLARPHEIDLVILDVNLPGADGTTILKAIKQKYPDLPVLMLTGHSSTSVAIRSLQGRADDFLEKPFDPPLLVKTIRRLLAGRPKPAALGGDGLAARIERVKQFAERNCHKKVELADAARVVGLCPKYLSRMFREHTGVTFSQYRLQKKVARAQELLRQGDATVERITEELGYQNPESFIRIFKKVTGQTPSRYRRRPAQRPGKK